MFYAASAASPEDEQLEESELAILRASNAAVIWSASLWLSEAEQERFAAVAKRVQGAGLQLFAEIDPARFPLDHRRVAQAPEAFAVRRASDGSRPVDPRKPLPATGEAIARFRLDDYRDSFVDELAERLTALAALGISGCRIASGARIPPELLQALREKLRGAGVALQFLAGPAGADRQALVKLGRAGCDYLVSSFHWWDLSSPWLLEEAAQLGAAAPVLHEIRDESGASATALRTRIEAAAVLGDGLILPLRLAVESARAGELPHLPEGDVAGGAPLHRLSGSSSPVTAILRSAAPELRHSATAELILINRSSTEQALGTETVHSTVGAEFTAALLARARAEPALQPGEVRRLTLERAGPIVSSAAPAQSAGPGDRPRLVIEEVDPRVDGGGGRYPVKRVVGDLVTVEATIFADGHEQLAAELLWRAADAAEWTRVPMQQLPNDRWRAHFPLTRLGRHEYFVEGWLDRFGGYRRDLRKKVDAGVAQLVDLAEGRELVKQAAARIGGKQGSALQDVVAQLKQSSAENNITLLLSDELAQAMARVDDRPHRCQSYPQPVDAERIEAHFSSWYEIFPRSITQDKARHGTFADVIGILPHVRDMGFDTLYFPPIHPIGLANRKGPNNTLTPGPEDVGSPYAIGSADGGHDAIHPELGSFEDFAALVTAAQEHGLEIALDFAIQCSPDHPWLKEHPGWFTWRPDGSMKYAENPPKKYQDIVNVDFYGPDAVPALWEALRDVILLWVQHGVKTFRVDNPHTKPLPFWEWMIGEVRARHPEVIFLSEAFTRPTMMYRLAKVGFSQSYTYFTWRDRKQELVDYITELTTTAPKEFYRPHFFVNTPDINPHFLQTGGRAGHQIRAVLAATLSGLWGVYSGFELCEATPLGAGKEEYLDSEKYEVKPYQARRPGDIVDDVTLLNRLRRAHPALQTHLNTRFYPAHDENVIWYGKPSPASVSPSGEERLTEMIMVMVNMDPHHAHECDFELPLWQFGLHDEASIAVEDLAAGHRFEWHGKTQHIRLDPSQPYRIWRLSLPGEGA
jgi:starch synthase (maltosyl-transferring)